MILTEEKPNVKRQFEFDFVKAFAIFTMIIIHVYEELSEFDNEAICSKALDVIIQFCGGPFAAPVFMIAMGVGMVYSSHRKPADFVKRGVILFVMAYVLNFVRDTLPLIIYRVVNHEPIFDSYYFVGYTFNVDILMFAGLAFMLTGLLKKLKVPVLGMGAIAIVMQVIGTWISSRIEVSSVASSCFHGLIFYTGEASCFPVLIWYIYPVIGIIMAKYLRHVNDTDKLYKLFFGIGSVGIFGLCGALVYAGYDIRNFFALYEDAYYQQNFISVLFTLFTVMLWLAVAHFILGKIKAPKFKKCISYLSSNLNQIYIAQWILIEWSYYLLALAFDFCFPIKYVIPAGLCYFAVAVLCVIAYQKIKGNRIRKAVA